MIPYHHGDLRRELVAKATEIVSTRGEAALSLREVGRAANVSHAAPYHHFANKQALLAAVAEEGFVQLAAALRGAKGKSARARLSDMAACYVEYADAHRGVFQLMFGPALANRDEHPALRVAADSAFGELASASVAVAGEKASLELAIAGWSLAHGVASLSLAGVLSARAKNKTIASMTRNMSDLIDETRARGYSSPHG